MKKQLTVLISDQTIIGKQAEEALLQQGFNVILCGKDGNEVLKKIDEFRPDAVIIEAFMLGIDAISVKKRYDNLLSSNKKQIMFFAMGDFGTESIEKELIDHGFKNYFVKPLAINNIIIQLFKLKENIKKIVINNECKATHILHHIGVPANLKGYRYLRHGILLCIDDSNEILGITKTLYPLIAKEFDTKSSCVERAIRNAIETAWERGNADVINDYFGYTINASRGRPTNSEFISMIAENIFLDNKLNFA